jgi:hypothetical protein
MCYARTVTTVVPLVKIRKDQQTAAAPLALPALPGLGFQQDHLRQDQPLGPAPSLAQTFPESSAQPSITLSCSSGIERAMSAFPEPMD